MFLPNEFPSVERCFMCDFFFWPCRQSCEMSIKGRAVSGRQGGCPSGTWWEAQRLYFPWVCDDMATMTGCCADGTWCWALSVPPSSSVFGRLAWGSPNGSAKFSALGCRLTSTGGELEAWAAKIWRGLFRPAEENEDRKLDGGWM